MKSQSRQVVVASMLALSMCVGGSITHAVGQDERPPTAEEVEAMRAAAKKRAAERAALPKGYSTRAGATSLQIPQPILRQELEHYADIMELSEAQRRQWHHLYEQHIEHTAEYRARVINPLIDQEEELMRRRRTEGTSSVPLAKDALAIYQKRTQAIQELYRAERTLFDAMSPYLSDDQLELIDRAYDQRRRDVLRKYLFFGFPGADLDVALRLWELQQSGVEAQPNDREEFRWDLSSYERQATALFEALDVARINRTGHTTVLLAELNTLRQRIPDRDEFLQSTVDLRARFFRLHEAEYQAKRRIHDLNQRFIARLCSNLNGECAEELRSWFHEAAYPVVFPNPFDVTDIVRSALLLDDLSEEQRVILNSMKLGYNDQTEAYSDKMMREYMNWYALHTPRSGVFSPKEYDLYQATMMRYQRRRMEAAEELIAILETTLESSQLDSISVEFVRYEKQVATFEAARQKRAAINGQWPGPFD